MQRAREWICNNVSSPKCGSGCPRRVILFGHSSGATHIAMNLYAAGKPKHAHQHWYPAIPIPCRRPEQRWRDSSFPLVAGVKDLDPPF